MIKFFLTKSPFQTRKLGENLSKRILKIKSKKKGLIIGLEGDLGGGKTTFLQGFAKGLGIKQRITSPTFVIMKRFKIRKNLRSNSCKFASFYHVDCYRIEKPKEILNLGFKKNISDSKNIIAIEWANKIKKVLPQNIIWLKLDFIDENTRKVTLRTRNLKF